MALETWMTRGLCWQTLEPDSWFPDSHTDRSAILAKRTCKVCPVRRECETKGGVEKHGIWGGVFRSEAKADEVKLKRAAKAVEVDPLESQRRLRALAALGWTGKDVAVDIRRYTGMVLNPRSLDALCHDEDPPRVPRDVATAIQRAFKHLSNTTGSGNKANETIAYAKQMKWPTPRQWRGRDITDPEVYPDADED
jgi:hypothetical protein